MKADDLLVLKPFNLDSSEKEPIFLASMREAVKFHFDRCEKYRQYCKKKNFDPNSNFSLKEIPMLPTDTFKKVRLLSVPEKNIIKVIHSSSTKGEPSTIPLDDITAKRQIKAFTSITSDFIGSKRKIFIILDSEKTPDENAGELSSRGMAIRSMMPFARKIFYIVDRDFKLNKQALEKALKSIDPEDEVCIFGFTYMIYSFLNANSNQGLFRKINKPIILHLGGWKRLNDLNLSKAEFYNMLSDFFNTEKNKIIDFYGMTEQLGAVYPDCGYGYKHVPISSEIIIRDIHTLEAVHDGSEGFIQLLSPLPNSYPGISILTDDIGVIEGSDDCKCGRKGKRFLFKRRAETAEIRGCGDALKVD